MNRRTALRSGWLVGLGLLAMAAASDAAGQGSGDGDALIAAALRDLQGTVQRQIDLQIDLQNGHWRVVRQVQEQQRTFLKASHRYPEFIEVGPRAWESLVEWHFREQVPLNVARLADGRYAMTLMFSTVLLRPELDDNYIGFGYDSERPNR